MYIHFKVCLIIYACIWQIVLNYLPPSFPCEIGVSYFDKVIIAMSFEVILETMVAEKYEYVGKQTCVLVYQDSKSLS